MTETTDDLWRRLLAAGRVRWMSGMLWRSGRRTVFVSGAGTIPLYEGVYRLPQSAPDDSAPDWTDPATLGCLLAMAREAWGDQRMSVAGDSRAGWSVRGGHQHGSVFRRMGEKTYETEVEALLRAIEAAPRRT